MIGRPLDIEQSRATALAQPSHERHEGHLRGIALTVEHRFAGEEAADLYPVQPPDKHLATPDLDGMRPAKVVKPGKGMPDVVVDPALPLRTIPAAFDHLVEGFVEGHPKAA